MRKRLISLLLILAMLATVIPGSVMAVEQDSETDLIAQLLAQAQAREILPEEACWYDNTKPETAALAADENSMESSTRAIYPTNYPNTWVNTGDQATDIAQIACTQIGYTEIPENHTKYNAWYYGSDTTVSWCATFISWCANQASVPTSIMAKTALAGGYDLYNMQYNSFGAPAFGFGSQRPKPGDVAYITSSGNTSDHVGLVIAVDNNYVYTAEGNASDTVGQRMYSLRSGYQAYGGNSVSGSIHIIFFARPNYRTAAGAVNPAPNPYPQPQPEPEPDPAPVARETVGCFEDVYTDEYFAKPVLWAVENQVTNGTSPTTFSPNEGCTRAQAVTFLWRVAGCPEPESTECPFVDVSPNFFYYKAVMWAVENKITSGMGDNLFCPDSGCTRGQIVTMMYRAVGCPANYPYYYYYCPFNDVPRDSYYCDAVIWATANKITNGVDDSTFAPDTVCTRGQIVTFLYRAVNN